MQKKQGQPSYGCGIRGQAEEAGDDFQAHAHQDRGDDRQATLPSEWISTRQVISEMTTMLMSKISLMVENGFLVTLEMASMAPSPASGTRSIGT